MKTILIYWLLISNGVATDSVKSVSFESMADCEKYAVVLMQSPAVVNFKCIEGYSLPQKEG